MAQKTDNAPIANYHLLKLYFARLFEKEDSLKSLSEAKKAVNDTLKASAVSVFLANLNRKEKIAFARGDLKSLRQSLKAFPKNKKAVKELKDLLSGILYNLNQE